MRNVPPDPALPPRTLSRRVLTSGRGPREVTVDDIPELYGGDPVSGRPAFEEQIRIRSDEQLVRLGLDSTLPAQYEALWKAIYFDHGLAHRYIGGNVGGFGSGDDVAHRSFEDPFVFLLHSNVERLWSSWQLSREGFNPWEEPSWRMEPAQTYGPLIKELTDTMRPWNGELPVEPWGQPNGDVPIRATDQEVLRPGLYDRYTFENNLCAAWATLLLGKRLSTHDVVRLTVELDAVSRDTVEVVLRTGPDVFWWKAIRLPDWTMIETEAANAEVSALHSAADLVGRTADLSQGARSSVPRPPDRLPPGRPRLDSRRQPPDVPVGGRLIGRVRVGSVAQQRDLDRRRACACSGGPVDGKTQAHADRTLLTGLDRADVDQSRFGRGADVSPPPRDRDALDRLSPIADLTMAGTLTVLMAPAEQVARALNAAATSSTDQIH